jgi:hypothetical protein
VTPSIRKKVVLGDVLFSFVLSLRRDRKLDGIGLEVKDEFL